MHTQNEQTDRQLMMQTHIHTTYRRQTNEETDHPFSKQAYIDQINKEGKKTIDQLSQTCIHHIYKETNKK